MVVSGTCTCVVKDKLALVYKGLKAPGANPCIHEHGPPGTPFFSLEPNNSVSNKNVSLINVAWKAAGSFLCCSQGLDTKWRLMKRPHRGDQPRLFYG